MKAWWWGLGCILLLSSACSGQWKIGNISADKKTFVEYLGDCYEHPDTVLDPYPQYGCQGGGGSIDSKSWDRITEQVEALKKRQLGTYTDKYCFRYFIVIREVSETDFIKYLQRKNERRTLHK